MKKITLVNQVTGPLFIDIANAFSLKGYETTLLTGQVEKTYADIEPSVKMSKLKSYNRSSGLKRMLTWTSYFVQAFFKLLFSNHKQHLLLVSNPPFGPFLGLFFNKLFGQPYSVLVYDIYPDALVNFNVFKENSFVVKTWKKLNRSLFNNAEKVITISDSMSETIKPYYGRHENLIMIPNWVNSEFIKPIPKNKNWFIEKYNLQDKIVVLYSGNLGITHDLESIVEAARILYEVKEIQFVIIGDGAKKEKLEQLVQQYKLDNVLMLPFQDAEVIPFSMTSSDISIVTLAKGAATLSVPSKTYYMMASGAAMIALAQKESELSQLIGKYKLGRTVEPDQPNELANTILELTRDKQLLTELKSNALKASGDFTPANAEKYVELI